MTTDIPGDRVFAQDDDVLMTESGGVTVLMSMDSGKFVELNGTGSAIWELTDGQRDVAEIAHALQGRFEVDPAECLDDVREFYARMRDEKLVRATS